MLFCTPEGRVAMAPTFVVDAPPAGDEAVAQVEGDLVAHAHRKATRLDVICE